MSERTVTPLPDKYEREYLVHVIANAVEKGHKPGTVAFTDAIFAAGYRRAPGAPASGNGSERIADWSDYLTNLADRFGQGIAPDSIDVSSLRNIARNLRALSGAPAPSRSGNSCPTCNREASGALVIALQERIEQARRQLAGGAANCFDTLEEIVESIVANRGKHPSSPDIPSRSGEATTLSAEDREWLMAQMVGAEVYADTGKISADLQKVYREEAARFRRILAALSAPPAEQYVELEANRPSPAVVRCDKCGERGFADDMHMCPVEQVEAMTEPFRAAPPAPR